MSIVKMNVSDINPAKYNPRKDLAPGDLEYEQIKNSIRDFGMVEPLVWNASTSTLVSGHQRLKVLIDMGIAEVDVSVVEMSVTKEKALNVALNKISGKWDDEKLSELMEELAAEADKNLIELTGFSEAELEELIGAADEEASCVNSGEDLAIRNNNFSYQEQYGVIVMCENEAHQREVYGTLSDMGYDCKVVAT